ncbi:MerR family DNA-binding transcriptional regulator [Streptomyces sp. NPDC056672]|uniref:MerR family DNA-binding transcriptional regulator n=1 Tax=Streptomyces sp. NPDC056672 TaxID=3345906 RepID=UPI00369A303E
MALPGVCADRACSPVRALEVIGERRALLSVREELVTIPDLLVPGPPTWSIRAVARQTGLPVKVVRHWSDVGVVPPAGRTAGGYRRYDAVGVARLHLARTLGTWGWGSVKSGLPRTARTGSRRWQPHASRPWRRRSAACDDRPQARDAFRQPGMLMEDLRRPGPHRQRIHRSGTARTRARPARDHVAAFLGRRTPDPGGKGARGEFSPLPSAEERYSAPPSRNQWRENHASHQMCGGGKGL